MSLFMWNGKTAQCLLHWFMTGDTRMVFATTRVASHCSDLKGLRLLHHDEKVRKEKYVLHDCVRRTIGFTLMQGKEAIREAVVIAMEKGDEFFGVATVLHRTWYWLTLDRRLVKAHTGEDPTHVYLLEVDESLRVVELLFLLRNKDEKQNEPPEALLLAL